jgi:hypothetical protein
MLLPAATTLAYKSAARFGPARHRNERLTGMDQVIKGSDQQHRAGQFVMIRDVLFVIHWAMRLGLTGLACIRSGTRM